MLGNMWGSMWYRIFSQNLAGLVKQRNGFLVISVGLSLCNFLLVGLFFAKKERIIIVPAYLKQSFWNEGSLVSRSYIEEMSMFFANLMLNTTPDSHKYRRDVILRYVAPEGYHNIEKKLIEEEDLMSKNAVTTQFMPKEIKVDIDRLESSIIGTLTRYIAGDRVGQTKECYHLKFGYSGGIFMLQKFESKPVVQ